MKLMSDSLSKIAPAIVKAQSKMGNAVKGSNNPFFKSKYSDINSVREACIPALNEEGISVLQPMVFFEGKKFVQTIFLHESGEFISGITEIVYPKEGNPQDQGSGSTYARRFGLQSMANVGTEDDDANSISGKSSVRSQVAPQATAQSSTAQPAQKLEQTPAPVSTGGSKSFRKPKTTAPEEL